MKNWKLKQLNLISKSQNNPPTRPDAPHNPAKPTHDHKPHTQATTWRTRRLTPSTTQTERTQPDLDQRPVAIHDEQLTAKATSR